MPYRDGTGPMGYGPLTGRGMSPCRRGVGFSRGYGRGFGSGFGRGFGRGYGMMGWEYPPYSLKDHKAALEEELKRINELLASEEK